MTKYKPHEDEVPPQAKDYKSMTEELPGMLELARAIDKGEWPHTMDARIWAQEFMKVRESGTEIDEGLMIGWFANAIMAGYDRACEENQDA